MSYKLFKYFNISKTKKIRYLHNSYKNNLYIVFLHGFMSDIEGEKPKTLFKYTKKNNLSFLAPEYSGHGKSNGKFLRGNISKWTYETKVIIKKIVKKNDFIIVGSSMGAWLALNQFKYFKKQIKGFLGIGSAPEFLENLMWKKFSKKIKKEIIFKKTRLSFLIFFENLFHISLVKNSGADPMPRNPLICFLKYLN